MYWVLAVLTIGAVFRVTRFVTLDTLFDRPRRWVIGRGELWSVFITCPWCVSIWVAAVAAPIAVWWGDNRVVLSALLGLTASAVAGLMDRFDQ